MDPKVTVIIPVYNCRETVSEAIESVLAQTLQDFELSVVDDGSTDGTDRAVERYRDRVTLLRQENRGPAVARNAGIRKARGDLISFLDERQNKFQVKILDMNPVTSERTGNKTNAIKENAMRISVQEVPVGNLARFLDSIENSGSIVKVQRIRIKPNFSKPTHLDGVIQISTFVIER